VETNEDPSTLSRTIHRHIGRWASVTVARWIAERLSRRNRSSKIGLRFIPRLSIHPGHMSATNTFSEKRPRGNVLRRLRTMPRLAFMVAEDGLELGASSFCHHCLTASGAYEHPAIIDTVTRIRLQTVHPPRGRFSRIEFTPPSPDVSFSSLHFL
jgi:hypothetical protein